jgi:flagellar M-ring protein FliF
MEESTALTAGPALGGFAQSFIHMPVGQKLTMMVGIAATAAVIMGAWMWSQAPDYRVLYSNLADRDGGAIIASLQQMNVPYKFAEGGGAILVPSNQVHDARLKLASQGLPKGGTVGFELMENQKFGATQFQEQVNFQRGLEGELAKSVQSLSAVQAARVHLALPKASVFLRDQQKPSASVLLNLYPGKSLDRAQVSGILHLVASSVPDLTPENVSIVDQNGKLLTRNGDTVGTDATQLDPNQLAYVQQVEQATIKRITDILEPITGPGNARVQVTADIDFSRIESMAETFKPNKEVKDTAVRSAQLSESTNSQGGGAQGVPGALSNQPPANATAPIGAQAPAGGAAAATTTATASSRKDSTINYEVDKTISHTRAPVGGIKRLTAAVVINYRKQVGDKGKVTQAPLKPQEIEQVNALVREAMGFSKERGDSLNVLNTPFNEAEKEIIPPIPFWKQADNIATAKEWGKDALLIGLIAYILFGVLKPFLRRMAEQQRQYAAELPTRQAPLLAGQIAAQGNQLEAARQIARQDPKIVANVVKTWVGKDE